MQTFIKFALLSSTLPVYAEGRGLARGFLNTDDHCIARYQGGRIQTTNQTFYEARDAYRKNWSSATIVDCEEVGEGALICPFQTIESEAEYQSACLAAGGEILTVPFDFSCRAKKNGNDITVDVNQTSDVECLSPSVEDACIASIRTAYRTERPIAYRILQIQEDLISRGFVTDASCEGALSGADKNGIGFVSSMTMVVMTLIVGFHYF